MRIHATKGALLSAVVAALFAIGAPRIAGARSAGNQRLFRPAPQTAAIEQMKALTKAGKFKDAMLIAALEMQPRSVWLVGGTPEEVKTSVRSTLHQAAMQRAVPVFVAYNLPYRDCGQYSSGGGIATADYLAWIDGIVTGIGKEKAIVILEPDGLGIIPYNVDLQGNHEWCQPQLPANTTGEALNEARYTQLNGAVDRFATLPNVNVYLDGTHSAWLGTGEAAYRLSKAGVARTQGFFLNTSNYQPTPQLVQYGRWVSKCLWFATDPASFGAGHFDWCGSQYYPATASDPATWALTDQWYVENVESQTAAYPGAAALAHFVVDTGRNGLGPWSPTAGTYSGDPETWCNAPHRGLGLRPTLHNADPNLDALLWIKVPGESDGACTRGTPGPMDPEWKLVDPVAGAWFPEQALELARLAEPPLW